MSGGFATDHPDIVRRVIAAYEKGPDRGNQNPGQAQGHAGNGDKAAGHGDTRQLERTDLSQSRIGEAQRKYNRRGRTSLQKAGVVKPDVDVKATVSQLIDQRYTADLAGQ